MKRITFLALILSGISFFSSCKKDNTVQYTYADNSAPQISLPSDATGFFWASSVKTSSDYNLYQYSGACTEVPTSKLLNIPNNANSQPMSIGRVLFEITKPSFRLNYASYDGHTLPAVSSGGCVSIIYNEAGPSDSIHFGTFSNWAFSSYLADSVQDTIATSLTDNIPFPTITDISSTETVSTQTAYTLFAAGAVTGDSVMFIIKGPKNTIHATQGANAGSCSFTATQMASLGTTGGNKYGLLQIVPYRMASQTVKGYKFYVLKEACLSKYVVLN